VPLLPAAEEFALHMIIGMAEDYWKDGVDEAIADVLEQLPCSILDDDFHMVSEVAFLDHDVMMLYDLPQVSCACGAAVYCSCIHDRRT
jgi:hypothetical protein